MNTFNQNIFISLYKRSYWLWAAAIFLKTVVIALLEVCLIPFIAVFGALGLSFDCLREIFEDLLDLCELWTYKQEQIERLERVLRRREKTQ